jgi:hypothetical protein
MDSSADYVEGDGVMHEIFNYTLDSFNSTFVRLHHRWINATFGDPPGTFRGADLYMSVPPNSTAQFSVTPGNNGTFTPPTIDILVPNTTPGIVRVAVVTNETSLTGLNTQNLFLSSATNDSAGLQTALRGLADGTNEVAKQVCCQLSVVNLANIIRLTLYLQVSFLTYADKFTAGGWRFLTVRFPPCTQVSIVLNKMSVFWPRHDDSTASSNANFDTGSR